MAFHLVGALLTVGVTLLAAVALVLVAWGASTCGGDTADPHHLRDLREGILVVTAGWSMVPVLWAALARATRFEWRPWAVVAGSGWAAGLALAVSRTEVGTWCF